MNTQSKYILLSFFFLLFFEQSMTQSINILDSLKLYPDRGEVRERKFQGIIPAASCVGIEYTLYLYNQIYSGDGVYKLRQKYLSAENGEDVVFITYGRQYTLRGDARNLNAVVYQLIAFPLISASPPKENKSEDADEKTAQIINLLYHNNGNLELLNKDFKRASSSLNYILKLQ